MELCSECHLFLWRDKNYTRQSSWVDTWPSFYWHLLSGSDRSTGVPFACTYGGEYIWKLIPDSLREYWRPSVSALLEKAYPFVALGGEEPPSFFRDITSTVATFRKEVSCYTYGALLKVLEPSRVGKEYDTGRPFLIPDVLCPWGCSEFCFAVSHMNPAILLQHLLARVELDVDVDCSDKLYTAETMRLDYFRLDTEEVDRVLLNKEWPILPSMMFVPGEGMMVCACRHHATDYTRKRLYCHPPRKAQNLSSIYADQLAPVTVQQKVARNVVRRVINTTPTSSYSNMGYAGFNTSDVLIGGRFDRKGSCYMNNIHEIASLCRQDIRQLLDAYVKEGIVTPGLASCLREDNAHETHLPLLTISYVAPRTPLLSMRWSCKKPPP